jgi:hypothetical protein
LKLAAAAAAAAAAAGLWEYAFKKESTSKQAFRLDGGEQVQVRAAVEESARCQVDMMSKRFKTAEPLCSNLLSVFSDILNMVLMLLLLLPG